MPSVRYLHYDVFTTRPFEGNQLAVFLDAERLDATAMQRLTNEMNFAESTFLLPPASAGTDVRMRIFTPAREMPMAGHPTVGTTFALASLGQIPRDRTSWVFGLNIGPVAVGLEWGPDGLAAAWMDQGRPEFRPPAASAADVLAAVNADPAAQAATGLPIEEGSCGNAFFFLPLATRAAVDACTPDGARFRHLRSAFPSAVGVFVFSPERGDDGADVYCRMFAPEAGVVEDPATGSAHGPLGAYLTRHRVVPSGADRPIVSAQGVVMGRPSRLLVRVESDGAGNVARVHVGGAAVRVGDGTLSW